MGVGGSGQERQFELGRSLDPTMISERDDIFFLIYKLSASSNKNKRLSSSLEYYSSYMSRRFKQDLRKGKRRSLSEGKVM